MLILVALLLTRLGCLIEIGWVEFTPEELVGLLFGLFGMGWF